MAKIRISEFYANNFVCPCAKLGKPISLKPKKTYVAIFMDLKHSDGETMIANLFFLKILLAACIGVV